MNYKIVNAKLLLNNADDVLEVVESTLYVKDSKIEHIGEMQQEQGSYELVDAKGMLVMPGLVNMHTHAYMQLFKGYADDVAFDEWLFKRIMPVEDTIQTEDAYWTSTMAMVEMLKTGTTCFADMHMFEGQSAKAATDAGIRAFIGRGLVGDSLETDGKLRFDQCLNEKEKYESDLVKFVLSPHAIYSCSPKMYGELAQKANDLGMLKQTHLSESDNEVENCINSYGKTPVQILDEVGFLDEKTILAHCVKVSDDDIEILKNSGASVVTNPASNAVLGNGVAPVCKMLESGVNMCLGTDSVASNNTLNMFREMNLLALIQKGVNQSSVAINSQDILSMATKNAAKALGMESQIGIIKEGAFADLIFVDLFSESLFPNNNIPSSLCHCANGSEVKSVMINGKFVMRNRMLLTIDEVRLRYEMTKITNKYLK